MLRYFSRRLAIGGLILFGISLISFASVYLLPGDPVTSRYPNIPESQRERIRERMGLNDPLPARYVLYLEGLVQGDWGFSYNSGRPVTQDLRSRIPASLEIAGYSMLAALVLGIPLGLMAAVKRNRAFDQATRLITSGSQSIPVFWSALMLIFLFYSVWGVAPAPVGRLPLDVAAPHGPTGLYTVDSLLAGDFRSLGEALSHLALPVTSLTLFLIGPIAKISRTAFIDTLQQRYILAARGLGVPERIVLTDALRNSLLSIVTVAGFLVGYLVTGDALVEKVFSWPGMGLYAVDAVAASDHAAVQGVLLVVAVTVLGVNLAVDLIYAFLDPRIRLQYRSERD